MLTITDRIPNIPSPSLPQTPVWTQYPYRSQTVRSERISVITSRSLPTTDVVSSLGVWKGIINEWTEYLSLPSRPLRSETFLLLQIVDLDDQKKKKKKIKTSPFLPVLNPPPSTPPYLYIISKILIFVSPQEVSRTDHSLLDLNEDQETKVPVPLLREE